MATAAPVLPDWEVGPIHYPRSKRLALLSVPVVTMILVLLGGLLLGRLVFWSLWLITAVLTAWRVRPAAPLVRLDRRPLEHARFTNIVSGLAAGMGIEAPTLYEIGSEGPNALVVGGRQPAIAVTRPLLDAFTRTEQEAVAAHCLVRIGSRQMGYAHLARLLGRLGNGLAPPVGFEDDIHAAALTRYPPALASAIEKATPNESSDAPFWFVARSASHRDQAQRAAVLRDL